jgi:hypothetical protein
MELNQSSRLDDLKDDSAQLMMQALQSTTKPNRPGLGLPVTDKKKPIKDPL